MAVSIIVGMAIWTLGALTISKALPSDWALLWVVLAVLTFAVVIYAGVAMGMFIAGRAHHRWRRLIRSEVRRMERDEARVPSTLQGYEAASKL